MPLVVPSSFNLCLIISSSLFVYLFSKEIRLRTYAISIFFVTIYVEGRTSLQYIAFPLTQENSVMDHSNSMFPIRLCLD